MRRKNAFLGLSFGVTSHFAGPLGNSRILAALGGRVTVDCVRLEWSVAIRGVWELNEA
jgi:hypothetical protein